MVAIEPAPSASEPRKEGPGHNPSAEDDQHHRAEKLPQGGFVLAPNHVSHLDPLFISQARRTFRRPA